MAPKLDLAVRNAQLAKMERSILAAVTGDLRVLDLGCGTGRMTEKLGVHEKVGLDRDPSQLARAKARGLKLAMGDAHALPFRCAAFDAIVATDWSFYYLDVTRAFAECRRVLAPRGRLVLHYPSDTIWTPRKPFGLTPIDRGHPERTVTALLRAAADNGFELELVELWRFLRAWPYLLPMPARVDLPLWSHGVFWFRPG